MHLEPSHAHGLHAPNHSRFVIKYKTRLKTAYSLPLAIGMLSTMMEVDHLKLFDDVTATGKAVQVNGFELGFITDTEFNC